MPKWLSTRYSSQVRRTAVLYIAFTADGKTSALFEDCFNWQLGGVNKKLQTKSPIESLKRPLIVQFFFSQSNQQIKRDPSAWKSIPFTLSSNLKPSSNNKRASNFYKIALFKTPKQIPKFSLLLGSIFVCDWRVKFGCKHS